MTFRRGVEIGVVLACSGGLAVYLSLPTSTTIYEIWADPGSWCGKTVSVPVRVIRTTETNPKPSSGQNAASYLAADVTNNSPIRVVLAEKASVPFFGSKLQVTGTLSCEGSAAMFLQEQSRTRLPPN